MRRADKINYGAASLLVAASLLLFCVSLFSVREPYASHQAIHENPFSLPVLPESQSFDASGYAIVTEKSIFVPTRQLSLPANLSDGDESLSPAPGVSIPFTLIGITVSGTQKIAVLKRSDSSLAVSLRVGETMDGWTLQSIQNNRVVLQSDQAKQSLRLADDKKDGISPQ